MKLIGETKYSEKTTCVCKGYLAYLYSNLCENITFNNLNGYAFMKLLNKIRMLNKDFSKNQVVNYVYNTININNDIKEVLIPSEISAFEKEGKILYLSGT